jgi:hypothetical protein
MKEYFTTSNIEFVGQERVIEYISLCIKMLTKIIDDDFYSTSHDMVEKIDWKKLMDEGEPDEEGLYELKVTYVGSFTHDDLLARRKIETQYMEKYKKTLYNVLSNRIQTWWI